MSHETTDPFADVDAEYNRGWSDGRSDLLRHIKDKVKHLNERQLYLKELLSDPEKIADLASKNEEFNAAIVTAVVAMLLAENDVPNSD